MKTELTKTDISALIKLKSSKLDKLIREEQTELYKQLGISNSHENDIKDEIIQLINLLNVLNDEYISDENLDSNQFLEDIIKGL